MAAKSFFELITASGGANGTRVNSAGLIEAAVCPRFDYDPVTLEPLGVWNEQSATNIIERSNNFTSLSTNGWNLDGATITAAAATGIDGTMSASRLAQGSGSHRSYHFDNSGVTGVKTFSIYAKPDAGSKLSLGLFCFDTFPVVEVDLIAHTVSGGSGYTYTAEEGPNGFWRYTFSGSTTSASGNSRYVELKGHANGSVFVTEAQLESASFASSLIRTTTATVTRTADLLSMTGTNFSDWFNPVEGTFVVESSLRDQLNTPHYFLLVNDGTAANLMQLWAVSGVMLNDIVTASVAQTSTISGVYPATDSIFRHAFAYEANDCAFCLDGAAPVTDTSVTLPSGLNQLVIGPANSHIRVIKYYNTRLSNAELQALTA